MTSWGSFVYYIDEDGPNQVLLDTSEKHIAAGISLYDPKSRTT